MKRSVVLGSLVGILLTLLAAYLFLNVSGFRPSDTRSSGTSTQDETTLPLVDTLERYSPDFLGNDDLLLHRVQLQPYSKLEDWDRSVKDIGLTNLQFSAGCSQVAPTRAIFIPPHQTEAILTSKINLHFFGADIPRCVGAGWKVAIVEDDFVDGKTLYKVIGEAVIDRVFEGGLEQTPNSFFLGLRTEPTDLPYLTNMNYGPVTSLDTFTVIRFTIETSPSTFDSRLIPPFVAGAEVLKPNVINKFFAANPKLGRPVLVDARQRSTASANYPGAVIVPFIPTTPIQTRFQLEFPVALMAGAKFDLRAVPPLRETPLVVFGNDGTDAAPLWLIRALRQQNYHRIFYVEGGFKELQDVKPAIQF